MSNADRKVEYAMCRLSGGGRELHRNSSSKQGSTAAAGVARPRAYLYFKHRSYMLSQCSECASRGLYAHD